MNLSDYGEQGYRGIDASLEISLFEYGFIFKKEQEREDTYTFIYGKSINENCQYDSFDWRTMSKKEFIELTQEKWFNLDGVLSFVGQTKEDFLSYFPYAVNDTIQYHGYENVMGSSYNSMIIENN